MRVVLRESADAHQSMHGSRTFITVDRAEFAKPHRKVAVAAGTILIDKDVSRAVHRLELILGILQFARRKHVLVVVSGVTGNLPEFAAGDVRRVYKVVSAL